MCSLVAVLGIPDGISLIFLSFWNFDRVSSRIFALIHYCWMPFTVSYFSFYSAILRFPGYHWFPLFVLLVTKTNVVLATLVAGSFLILHYFLLLRFLLRKSPADLPILGCPRRLTFLLSRLLDSTFSDPTFGCFSLCHFSQVSWFFLARLKVS